MRHDQPQPIRSYALKLSHEIQNDGERQNIYRFIRGMRDPDITFDLDVLASAIR